MASNPPHKSPYPGNPQQQQPQYHQTQYSQPINPYSQPMASSFQSPRPNNGIVGETGDGAGFLHQNMHTQLGLQIGTQMINAGQDYITQRIPMNMLKTYFNVTNSVWQRGVLRDATGQTVGYRPPREDINSPDLYIPAMAAVTYILLVGVVLGLRKAFHPEKLGVTATGAIVFILCELLLVKIGAYLLNLGNDVSILDMLAIIGYNFVPLIITLLFNLFFGRSGKICAFIYCSLAMAFFMLRSLRYSFLPDTSAPLVVNQRRTRVHFLFGVVFVQICPIIIFGAVANQFSSASFWHFLWQQYALRDGLYLAAESVRPPMIAFGEERPKSFMESDFYGLETRRNPPNSNPPNTCLAHHLHGRKRRVQSLSLETEDLTIGKLKRLRLNADEAFRDSNVIYDGEHLCQALIPYSVAPSEHAFRLAIAMDFPKTFLGRLIASNKPEFDGRNICDADNDSGDTGKELVVYQPPLSELLKEAAVLQEHEMQIE